MAFRKKQAILPLALALAALVSVLSASSVRAEPSASEATGSVSANLTPVQRRALERRHADGKTAAKRQTLVLAALRQRGRPYVWGGASRGGFDCSGLITYLYKTQRGISLPRTASAQARMGQRVPSGQLKAGDLLFFSTYRRGISHVGVYIGGGKFVHAANRRKGVRVDALTGYYARRFKGARRV